MNDVWTSASKRPATSYLLYMTLEGLRNPKYRVVIVGKKIEHGWTNISWQPVDFPECDRVTEG